MGKKRQGAKMKKTKYVVWSTYFKTIVIECDHYYEAQCRARGLRKELKEAGYPVFASFKILKQRIGGYDG